MQETDQLGVIKRMNRDAKFTNSIASDGVGVDTWRKGVHGEDRCISHAALRAGFKGEGARRPRDKNKEESRGTLPSSIL